MGSLRMVARAGVLALVVLLIATAGAVVADTCFEGHHRVAMWFYENPDWGQDPAEFFEMCMENNCGMT